MALRKSTDRGLEVRRWLALPVVSMFLLAALLTFVTMVAGIRYEHAALIEDSQRRAATFVQVRARLLQRTLRDHARWNDEAVERLLNRFDGAWADRNLGRDFVVTHDLSYVLVVDQAGRTTYGARYGEALAGLELDRFGMALPDLVKLARASGTQEPPTAMLAVPGESVHLVAASRLTAQAASGAGGGDTGAVLVLMRRLDGPVLRQVAEDYGFQGYRLAVGSDGLDDAQLPLLDAAGARLGTLTWHVAAPGSQLLRDVLPLAIGGYIVIAILLCLFLLRARRVAAGIEREAGESERRSALLARREAHLRAVLAQISDGILELDQNRCIRSANEAAAQILGMPVATLPGVPLARFLLDGERATERLLDAAEPGGESRQVPALSGTGREFTLEIDLAPAVAGEAGHLAVIRDVSDRERARHLLDLIASAMVVVDAECRKLFANQGAEALLATGDGLREQAGQIVAIGATGGGDLRRAVATAAGAGTGAIVRLMREGGRVLHAFVAPLRAVDRQGDMPVVITLRDPEAAWELPEAELGRLFGLTPAEARVVTGLVKGNTLREIAAEHGLSPNTVRNQLAQAFQKTGTARQSELVALALSSAGALAAIGVPAPTDAG